MVLTEVLNGLAKPAALRATALKMVTSICHHPNTEVAPQTAMLFREAFDLYGKHSDKEWGLTDCASCVLIRQRGITEILTYDHHFEQMGFKALLKEQKQ